MTGYGCAKHSDSHALFQACFYARIGVQNREIQEDVKSPLVPGQDHCMYQ